MFETVKKSFEVIFTVKKSRILDFLLIIFLSVNGVHNINTGFHAKQGDFKYVVSIRLSDAHLCTGTIIDETHILTILHVFIGKPVSKLSVVGGMSVIMHPFFDSIPVRKIFPHPEFRKLDTPGELVEDHWVNDIAILRLTDRFYWNKNYGPVPLMQREVDWSSCPDCIMISWQYPLEDSGDTVVQTWNFVYIISEVECLQWGIRVLEKQKCFISPLRNLLINYGDLGSPIVCGDVLIGFVVKITDNKVTGTPSTFLNILAYSRFIQKVLTNGESDVRPSEVPFIVSIWYNNNFLCGGSFLDATHILTAGHCVVHWNTTNLKVVFGYYRASQVDSTIQWSSVHNITFHPQYELDVASNGDDWNIKNDMAVLVLAKPVILGGTFDSLQYVNTSNVDTQLFCKTFHWKRVINNTREMITLKTTTAKILDYNNCQRWSVSVIQWQFCAGNAYYMHIADYRDIGNPIICGGRPLGILVKAFEMDDQSPPLAIFLWLQPYEEFIRSAMSTS